MLQVRLVERFGFGVLDADLGFLRRVRIHDEFVAAMAEKAGR